MADTDRQIVATMGVVGRAFFGQRFHSLTEIQRQAMPLVLGGHNVLLSAATASGKTEALCGPMVSRLYQRQPGSAGTIRMLLVAPTRALVNDLFARLEGPLSAIGWQCGRQTSDHRDKHRKPDVLITTPESLDSMLVRDGTTSSGVFSDHLLARVEAVFIDEVHLFDGSARGDQLAWLMRRLRKVRAFAGRTGLAHSEEVQICGASATVASGELLAGRLLGDGSEVVSVKGARPVEVLAASGGQWRELKSTTSLRVIRDMVAEVPGRKDLLPICELIARALKTPTAEDVVCRKLLVFVGARRLCDQLSSRLAEVLPRYRAVKVYAHHGSLERPAREVAERGFAGSRDAVLVATTTLEVGVDIGDVDGVVLVGPPPSTSSLLQRVGRAGRRSGVVRILPIARDPVEACAFASLLAQGRVGVVDEVVYAPRWSVFVQQVASLIAQSPRKRRKRNDLVQLATEVWPGPVAVQTAQSVLDELCKEEVFTESAGYLGLGEEWSDSLNSGGGAFHSNLDTDGTGRPVIDSSTGEVIAHVQGRSGSEKSVVLGGQRWDLVHELGEIFLRPSRTSAEAGTFQYAFRSAPTGYAYARHVARGFGLRETEAPLVEIGERSLLLHCGGSAYETVLVKLFPDMKRVRGLEGLGVWYPLADTQIESLIADRERVEIVIEALSDQLAYALAPGPHHGRLPLNVRSQVVKGLFGIERFVDWLASRRIVRNTAEEWAADYLGRMLAPK